MISRDTFTRFWICLVGLVQATAIVAVFAPKLWIDWCSELMGLAPLPSTPLAGYLARLSSAMYVAHGCTLMLVAYHLPKSHFMIRPFGCLSIGLGLLMIWIDMEERMPIHWTVIEAGMLLFNGAMFVWLGRPRNDIDEVDSES